MKKAPIYSKSVRKKRDGAASNAVTPAMAHAAPDQASVSGARTERTKRFARSRTFVARHERVLLVASSVLLCTLLFFVYTLSMPTARRFTQRDIDAAVLHTLEKTTLPSAEAKAFERVRRSVVRVVQEEDQGVARKGLHGVGTGVVIVDNGIILTSLHVVGTDEKNRIKVQFANGLESDAVVLRRQPENDLAVIQASTIPDDLMPATLRSTQGLATGDKVVAIGFPFDIGPSASAGIVSGLKRSYHSPEDHEILLNLIQFDAAANPGNSGGPLITMDGEVVGIVTAILSPHRQGTFIGIGFAVPIEVATAAAGEAPF
jgi:S1-C subfamily serine protease